MTLLDDEDEDYDEDGYAKSWRGRLRDWWTWKRYRLSVFWRYKVLRRPRKPVTLTSFDDALKTHYKPEQVEGLSYQGSALMGLITKKDKP